MAPKSMLEMLLKHKVFCIFMGDNFQLPQIDKNEAHDFLQHPDIFLSAVMRQAAESEIIQLTMKIRNGENIPFTKGNEVIVMPKREMTAAHMKWADQIICATNATRISLNNQMRQALGYSGLPQNGERMICLRNYWDDLSDDGEAALVNGTTGIINNAFESYIIAPSYLKVRNHKIEIIDCDFYTDEGKNYSLVNMDKSLIETGEKALNWKEEYALSKVITLPREFTYGYAITCWKAQGSEWDKVVAIEEKFPFDRTEHAKFLYTCCTRASKKLVLAR